MDLAALEERDFRFVFIGQSISTLGDFVFPIALAFAVLDLTGSATSIGLAFGARSIVLVAVVLLGGVIADRVPRRSLLLGADLVRFTTQTLLAILILTGTAQLWHVLALSAVYGAALGVFYPAWTGFVPLVVSTQNLQSANALRSLTSSIAEIGGPLVGGALVVLASAGWAIALDAATFLIGAAFLIFVRPSQRRKASESRSILADLRTGWVAFRSRRWIWTMTATFALGNALFAMTLVLGPVMSEREYGGAGAWATMLSAFGIGSLLGSLAALRIRPARLLLAGLSVAWCVSLPPLTLAAQSPVVLLALAGAAGGAGIIVVNTFWNTSLQQHVPENVLSRVSSYDWLGSLIAMPLGYALAGPLSEAFGLSATLWLVGMVALIVKLLPLGVPDVRELRSVTAPVRQLAQQET